MSFKTFTVNRLFTVHSEPDPGINFFEVFLPLIQRILQWIKENYL